MRQIISLLEATEVTVRPREKAKSDDTPFEVVGPDEMAQQLSVVKRLTGDPDEHLLWEMPLYTFRQHYHAEMRWHSHWTVRPAKAPDEKAFEGFEDSVLANLTAQQEEEAPADD